MEDFVTVEISKKLVEKGFDWETSSMYERNTMACRYEDYPKPTIPQVLKWLRVARNFHVSPDLVSDYSVDDDGNICEEWTYWSYSIHHLTDGPIYRDYNQFDHIEYKSWEDASLAGIDHVLDNLI